jgi:hypothetical protein
MKIRICKVPPEGFSDAFVKATKLPPDGYRDRYGPYKLREFDNLGIMLMVSCKAKRSWHMFSYKHGRGTSKLLGHYPSMRTSAAYKLAIDWHEHPDKREAQIGAGSFRTVAEEWIRAHVDKKKLRSKPQIERLLARLVYPRIGHIKFTAITRKDITELLKGMETKQHAVAQKVLNILRHMFRWYDKEYDWPSPIANLGNRYEYEPRQRLITDGELAAIWDACNQHRRFGPVVQMLFITGQRLSKIQNMWWDDVDENGVWTVRSEKREKGNLGKVQLPELALKIIREQPRHKHNNKIFAKVVNVYAAVRTIHRNSGTSGWVPHDARRFVKSSMQKMGIPGAISEACLGHSLRGIEKVYGVYDFEKEKGEALAKLAELIETITAPDKVVALPGCHPRTQYATSADASRSGRV